MRVFFDACVPFVLSDVLDALIRGDGDSAHHIRAMQTSHGLTLRTPDVDWIERLGADRPPNCGSW